MSAFESLAASLLGSVTGGANNVDTTTTPDTTASQTRSNYALCLDNNRARCESQNRSLWGWGPVNSGAAGQCQLDTSVIQCGTPPADK